MDNVLEYIKNCEDSIVLEDLKNQINKRLVELAGKNGMSTKEKIYSLLPLAPNIRPYIPSGENEQTPEEMLTDFIDEYMYVVREKVLYYSDIVECLDNEWNDGIYVGDNPMTKEQYDSVLEFILEDIKNGYKGFIWDW